MSAVSPEHVGEAQEGHGVVRHQLAQQEGLAGRRQRAHLKEGGRERAREREGQRERAKGFV